MTRRVTGLNADTEFLPVIRGRIVPCCSCMFRTFRSSASPRHTELRLNGALFIVVSSLVRVEEHLSRVNSHGTSR
jgi:hypothetical protein